MKTPIERAAEEIYAETWHGEELLTTARIAAIIRRELRKYSNSDVIDDITEGECTCPVGSYTACPVHKR